MAIIGIDLGTTNSLACIYQNGRAELIPNELGEFLTKSAVSLMEDGTILVGAAARERLISYPESTAASFKVWMGTDQIISLGNQKFKPEELSSFILKQLLCDARRYLGEPIEEAVISVPAYFNDNQRCATKLAAQMAGLTVKRLINEPSAAALYHRRTADTGDCRMMIIDFGGGTLDVSIVDCFENIVEITAIAGDNHLGGNDIDRAIVEYFLAQNGLSRNSLSPFALSSLYRQAEAAKIALSGGSEAGKPAWYGGPAPNEPAIPGVLPPACTSRTCLRLQLEDKCCSLCLTNELLRKLCEPIFQRVRDVIGRAMRNQDRTDRIDHVILAGGSSKLTVFGDFLEELFGRRPSVAARPDEIVALGVGLCAGIKERAEDLQDLVMTDVCPFSLGVATYNDVYDKTPHMAFLIQRSSMLPAIHQGNFYTLHNYQEALRFEIYQGEGYYASENLKLGELEVQVPPGPAGEQYATVTFTYDIDGILHVSARSSGGDYRDRLILNPNLHLSEEELKLALERISRIQLAAQGTQKDQLLLEKALRLYELAVGQKRELIAELIRYFQKNAASGNRAAREHTWKQMKQRLEKLEAQMEAEPIFNEFWTDDTNALPADAHEI